MFARDGGGIGSKVVAVRARPRGGHHGGAAILNATKFRESNGDAAGGGAANSAVAGIGHFLAHRSTNDPTKEFQRRGHRTALDDQLTTRQSKLAPSSHAGIAKAEVTGFAVVE
jgi:hypothetical protein